MSVAADVPPKPGEIVAVRSRRYLVEGVEHFANGRSYYPLDSQQIRLPGLVSDHPSPDWLQWHYQHRFLG